MSQSNAADAKNTTPDANDEHEIDRIMKEIEELEKKVDEPSTATATAQAGAETDLTKPETVNQNEIPNNVIPFRDSPTATSLVETDATPISQDTFMKKSPFDVGTAANSQGTLALKIGGCTTVNLEFEHAGLTVSFECNETGLTIRTDQGAEFKVPFANKAAA